MNNVTTTAAETAEDRREALKEADLLSLSSEDIDFLLSEEAKHGKKTVSERPVSAVACLDGTIKGVIESKQLAKKAASDLKNRMKASTVKYDKDAVARYLDPRQTRILAAYVAYWDEINAMVRKLATAQDTAAGIEFSKPKPRDELDDLCNQLADAVRAGDSELQAILNKKIAEYEG